MDWLSPSDLLPILGAVIAGGVIGFEREYRARPAGLRTHILVSLASALLMLAAVHQVRWMPETSSDVLRIDPVRMAHGVLTGVGLYDLATLGTVLAVVTLSAARWLDRTMPQKNFTEISVRSRRDTPMDEPELRTLLAEYDLQGQRLNHCLRDGGAVFELAGSFSGKGSLRLREVAQRLREDPRVLEFDILPRKD